MIASEDPKVCFNAAMLSLNQCLLDADVTRAEMYRIKSLARYYLLVVSMLKTRKERVKDQSKSCL